MQAQMGDILLSQEDALSCMLYPQRWLWAHLTPSVMGMRLTTNTEQRNVPLGRPVHTKWASLDILPHSSKWSWWLLIKITLGKSVHLMFVTKAAICTVTIMVGSIHKKVCLSPVNSTRPSHPASGKRVPSSLPGSSFQLGSILSQAVTTGVFPFSCLSLWRGSRAVQDMVWVGWPCSGRIFFLPSFHALHLYIFTWECVCVWGGAFMSWTVFPQNLYTEVLTPSPLECETGPCKR